MTVIVFYTGQGLVSNCQSWRGGSGTDEVGLSPVSGIATGEGSIHKGAKGSAKQKIAGKFFEWMAAGCMELCCRGNTFHHGRSDSMT